MTTLKYCFVLIISTLLFTMCGKKEKKGETKNAPKGEVKLMTLDPGHFHAALVQKFMYPQVDSSVYVYAPGGPELQDYLSKIESFNTRADNPTSWDEKVYTGPDFLEKMLKEKPGNVVVIAGNNAKKTEYIKRSIDDTLNVLADKPMAINPAGFDTLKAAFADAKARNVLLYDIMTERYEITTILQKELSQVPEVFGTLQLGSAENPSVVQESVHNFSKTVAGKHLIRPAWFFDVSQQGEGIVDVTTHLVDLVQWMCFPEKTIDYKNDIEVYNARRWATEMMPDMFFEVTNQSSYPDYLKKNVVKDTVLQVYANGEIDYAIKGVNAKVIVEWHFEAPEGSGDTHYSLMRGTLANLIIRQGKEQGYVPRLYVENATEMSNANFEKTLTNAVKYLAKKYPGIGVGSYQGGWEITIPDKYRVGHEAHFAQVTEHFLQYLKDGKLPDWEVPNMIAKYYITTKAYAMTH